MRIVKLTSETTRNILENMLKRSPSQYGEYEKRVQDIIANVKEKKDEAVFSYTRQFDKADINASNIRVTEEEIRSLTMDVDALEFAILESQRIEGSVPSLSCA